MQYKSHKIGKRIAFIPDAELEKALRRKLAQLKRERWLVRPLAKEPNFAGEFISTYGQKDGLRRMLTAHVRNRIFVMIDLVHAFHQVSREMIAAVFLPINEAFYDWCFVELGGKLVIPIGFPTSSFIFEIFASRRFDIPLVRWQNEHNGVATRYTDNILVTWRKKHRKSFPGFAGDLPGTGDSVYTAEAS